TFDELKLPGQPITGEWLIGRNVANLSAEELFRILRAQAAANQDILDRFATAETVDDHTLWSPDESSASDGVTGWSTETSALVEKLLAKATSKDLFWGSIALGQDRVAQPTHPCRKDLARFLIDAVNAGPSCEAIWTKPNRKLISVYPSIILPT